MKVPELRDSEMKSTSPAEGDREHLGERGSSTRTYIWAQFPGEEKAKALSPFKVLSSEMCDPISPPGTRLLSALKHIEAPHENNSPSLFWSQKNTNALVQILPLRGALWF